MDDKQSGKEPSALSVQPSAGGISPRLKAHSSWLLPIDDWPDAVWLKVGRLLGCSPMQVRIMRLMLVDELSNESIAHALGRTRMSVDTQITRLYKKVGVKSRLGLVKRVYEAVGT